MLTNNNYGKAMNLRKFIVINLLFVSAMLMLGCAGSIPVKPEPGSRVGLLVKQPAHICQESWATMYREYGTFKLPVDLSTRLASAYGQGIEKAGHTVVPLSPDLIDPEKPFQVMTPLMATYDLDADFKTKLDSIAREKNLRYIAISGHTNTKVEQAMSGRPCSGTQFISSGFKNHVYAPDLKVYDVKTGVYHDGIVGDRFGRQETAQDIPAHQPLQIGTALLAADISVQDATKVAFNTFSRQRPN